VAVPFLLTAKSSELRRRTLARNQNIRRFGNTPEDVVVAATKKAGSGSCPPFQTRHNA